jgi:predicted aminopeptidase
MLRTRPQTAALAAVLIWALSGCAGPASGVGYYWQSVSGHLQLMGAARPLHHWIDDAQTPTELRQRLQLAQRMRRFAVDALALPDNTSYQRYADLQRRAAVYNVVAAPELSLTLKQWCFPVAGCVGYRGYFSESDAKAFAASLTDGPMDVVVYPVLAYSTLGWMNWAGGDPLLNTFIAYPEGELARILFHELAHQVVYVADDTAFNESFATAVERLGGARWLLQAGEQAQREYAAFDARRQAFRALTRDTRERLKAIYENTDTTTDQKRQLKAGEMARFHAQYAELRQHWDGYKGYDAWVARANNASFGAQAAYDDLVPGFEALFEREGRDFARFYDAVRALAKLPPKKRLALLSGLTPDLRVAAPAHTTTP